MKMISVCSTNSDYGALIFSKSFNGTLTSEFIKKYFNDSETDIGLYLDETNIQVELHDFADICPKFIKYVRREIHDYDASKHSDFWFEDETIKY